MKYILVIAIEKYSDSKLHNVAYAMNDAKAFIEAWELHGFMKAGQYILLNDGATKTAIESQLRRMRTVLGEEDELVVYYAGHGLSVGGQNKLTAWDTQYHDFEHTSISLSHMVETLRKSKCSKIKFFLDACHSGIEMDPTMRSVVATPSDDELRDYLSGASHCVAFAACHADEKSYSSGTFKHGIWTYHLLQALNGNAPLALKNGTMLTSNTLQNYLRNEVPRSVSTTVTGGPTQTPWTFGGADGEFLIADIAPILAAREVIVTPASTHLPRISFKGEKSLQIKKLSGFKPTNTVPKDVDHYTENFVAKIGEKDIQDELDIAYSDIRKGMGYKRRDLKNGDASRSTGTIITPDFDYNITLSQDKKYPSQAILQREITHIKNPDAVLSDNFQSTFRGTFDSIEFSSQNEIDVLKLIDWIEDTEPEDIEIIDFNAQGDFCKLTIDGINGAINITPHSIELTSTAKVTPRELAHFFSDTWNALLPAAPQGLLPELNDSETK